MELLANSPVSLFRADGSTVEAAALAGSLVAFYFSAHWCPPCRQFTPMLKDFYEEVNGDTQPKKFEVVFVSSDDSEDACIEYMKAAHGDWLCLPFSSPLRSELKRKYGVCAGKEQEAVGVETRKSGIPGLVVVRPDGSEVEFNARQQVEEFGPPVLKKWLAKV